MHVVYLCSEYPPSQGGGIGAFTQSLARAVVRRGHRATAVGFSRGVERETVEEDHGVTVIRLATGSVRGVAALSEQRRLWSRLRQLVEGGATLVEGPELSFWATGPRFSVPRVIRMHGGHQFFAGPEGRTPLKSRSWMERRSFRHADHLVAVSHYVGDETTRLLGLDGRCVDVVPNAVDTELFRPLPTPSPEPGLLLFLGTVCEKKGIRQLVQALGSIADEVSTARLIVAGPDSIDRRDGQSFTAKVRALVRPDLIDRVEFVGTVDRAELGALLARAEVCVYPSHMEAMPVAWLEAMASGKALVGGDVGPAREVVVDGDSGLLCDPRDPQAIARAVLRVLGDDTLRATLEAGARRRTLEHFSLDRVTGENLALYERVAAGGG
jgi:glycosyltransferase involved in cell wall biosynthesis